VPRLGPDEGSQPVFGVAFAVTYAMAPRRYTTTVGPWGDQSATNVGKDNDAASFKRADAAAVSPGELMRLEIRRVSFG
jgi:hypothetical protein